MDRKSWFKMKRDAKKYMEKKEKEKKEKEEKEKKEKEKQEKEKEEKKQKLRERTKARLEADKKKKEAEKKNKQSRTQNTTAKPQPKKRKIKLIPKPKPQLNRDRNPILDMEGNYLPDIYRSNYLGIPGYDVETGYYINQGVNKNSVKCWTRYNKTGNPYTTCYNNDYSTQLRRGQPPKGGRGRKPTKSQLKSKKKELKPINREPDLNYTLI